MDFEKIKRLIQVLEDGALTSDEAQELIDTIVFFLSEIRPHIDTWYIRIILDGVKVSLTELKEHIGDA
jgi:hypothetical protein